MSHLELIFRCFLERLKIDPDSLESDIVRDLDEWLDTYQVGRHVDVRTISDRVIERMMRPKNAN